MTGQDTKRSRGWGAGFTPPTQSSVAANTARKPYSYVRESQGYTQLVHEEAQKNLKRMGAKFSDLFEHNPVSAVQKQAREYFLGLDKNQRSALIELESNSTP